MVDLFIFASQESVSKEKEDVKVVAQPTPEDDIPLFYSDIMPLLVRRFF